MSRSVKHTAASIVSVGLVFIDSTAAFWLLLCRLRSRFPITTPLTMGHQTTDAYSICGRKTVFYIHMAILRLIPQVLPMAILNAHIQEYFSSFFL